MFVVFIVYVAFVVRSPRMFLEGGAPRWASEGGPREGREGLNLGDSGVFEVPFRRASRVFPGALEFLRAARRRDINSEMGSERNPM